MRCPKCNTELNPTSKYCNKCGEKISDHNEEHETQYVYSKAYSKYYEKFDNNHNDQYSYSSTYSKTNNFKITSDEDYIKNYIGNNYEKIKKEGFSLCGFIFGPLYLVYRKIWSYLLLFIIIIIAVYYVDITMIPAIYAILSLFIGLKVNNIYMTYATRKVDEIKISNPDKSSTEIYEICGKKGRTINILLLILLISIVIPLTAAIFSEYEAKNKKEENPKYIESSSIDSVRKLNYDISNDFKLEKNYSNLYKNYKYSNENNNCTITIDSNYLYNKTINEYISENLYINPTDIKSNIESKTINNNNYEYLEIESNTYKRKIYYTKDTNYIYTIELSEKKQFENNICEKELDNIIDSIIINNN